jgi:hypothetical protein
MTLTVQAFRNGEAIGEWVATSQGMDEQQMADYIFSHAKDGIGFRFLGLRGIVEPSVCRIPAIAY